jgi:hypothetical protein
MPPKTGGLGMCIDLHAIERRLHLCQEAMVRSWLIANA